MFFQASFPGSDIDVRYEYQNWRGTGGVRADIRKCVESVRRNNLWLRKFTLAYCIFSVFCQQKDLFLI